MKKFLVLEKLHTLQNFKHLRPNRERLTSLPGVQMEGDVLVGAAYGRSKTRHQVHGLRYIRGYLLRKVWSLGQVSLLAARCCLCRDNSLINHHHDKAAYFRLHNYMQIIIEYNYINIDMVLH